MSPKYTSDSKERVRDAVDFVDLVSARTDLKRSGANEFTGLCPFHEERTPSFHINAIEKVYYCFGCQAAGDLFTFTIETEGVDFLGALELLADRYGVQLERDQEDPRASERRRRRERLYELLERTTAFYERYLWESEEAAAAREYLAGRDLSQETLRKFRVGFSPSEWNRVLSGSLQAGFSEQELYAAGLCQRSRDRGGSYDRFRERIMFPLGDQRGRVLGFGARALRADQQPKYLNTSEGEVYHKGRQLFGMHLARPAAAKANSVILAEGYTDVLALHQAGFEQAVGLMGTALTEHQITELVRMAPLVHLMLDADSAGQEAMLRAAALAAGRQLELRVVEMPSGSDPAEIVATQGSKQIGELIERAVPFVQFRVEQTLAGADLSQPTERDRMLKELGAVFATVPQGALREELVRSVADRLNLSEQLVASLTTQGSGQSRRLATTIGPARARSPLESRDELERTFLALCIALPSDGERALEAIEPDRHLSSPGLRLAAEHLRGRLSEPLSGLEGDQTFAALIAELVVRAKAAPASPETLEVSKLQLEKARLEREIKAAQREGGLEIDRLATEREGVLERIRVVLG